MDKQHLANKKKKMNKSTRKYEYDMRMLHTHPQKWDDFFNHPQFS